MSDSENALQFMVPTLWCCFLSQQFQCNVFPFWFLPSTFHTGLKLLLCGLRHQTSQVVAAWRQKPSLSHFQTLILTAIPTVRSYKMMVIVKMNMMIVRVMVALVVMMSIMMIVYYCCQWQGWVFHRLPEAQHICLLYQADSRGPGKQQQDRWNHIKWNECDWTPGLSSTHSFQLFLDYMVKESGEGFNPCRQIARGCLKVSVFFGFCIFEFKKLCRCQSAS